MNNSKDTLYQLIQEVGHSTPPVDFSQRVTSRLTDFAAEQKKTRESLPPLISGFGKWIIVSFLAAVFIFAFLFSEPSANGSGPISNLMKSIRSATTQHLPSILDASLPVFIFDSIFFWAFLAFAAMAIAATLFQRNGTSSQSVIGSY